MALLDQIASYSTWSTSTTMEWIIKLSNEEYQKQITPQGMYHSSTSYGDWN
ncbi:MAG: hypothetical protein ACXAB7_13200 [Candidatus Kariarchaeaceae archaeon]